MAEAFIQVLVNNMSSLIKEEIGLIMGVDKEMKKLSRTLTTIQAVLEDAEDKQLKSKPIQNWLCKLNDLTYEIDDVLDECATEVSKLGHKSSKFDRYYLKKTLNRSKFGRRIKEMTDKLDAVVAEREKFHLREMVVERQSKVATTRETGSVLNEPNLVYGRDEEMEKILDILMNPVQDSQQPSVLPILGIGGLGKTTLAQLVYNHPRVTQHFEKKLWVCVSDNFDTKTVIQTMIKSGTGSEITSDHLDTLQCHLQELLNQKKYLLILDDVWNEDQDEWAKLQSVLPCGSRGASIIVTTRLKKVADIMGTRPAHELSKLSEEHSWLLFRQRAFGHEMEEHPNLESIGRQIVKKCGGVPLAAKALGGLLRFKRKEKEWLYVKESKIWNLQTSILPALRLSYQHLPLQLRQCFAYCAAYPKDHEFEKKELIYCWMAHGYISSNKTMDMEDVGDEVWDELVLRSLFQDIRSFHDGQIVYFKMHDLVHDLAQSIMENKVLGGEVHSSDRTAINRNKIRQVNIMERYVAFPGSYVQEASISYTLKNFRHLRMLDATWTNMVDLPSEIDKLKRLRYLNLSYSRCLHTLPDTVCSLWNLKILNLNGCTSLVNLPKHIRDMKNLCHLWLENCDSLSEMPPKMGKLTSLRTLSVFAVGHKRGKKLDELHGLDLGGKLEIRHLERVKTHSDARKSNIRDKSKLRHLVLGWQGENASEQQERDEKVLEALEPHPNLEILEIKGFKGRYFPLSTRMKNIIEIHIMDCPNCSRLPPLRDLHHLKRLKLSNLAMLEYVMENEVKDGGQIRNAILFPSLKKLELSSLPNLKGWLKNEEEVGEIFPNLQKLYIQGLSPLLKKLPLLASLRKLSCNTLNLNSFSNLGNLTHVSVGLDNDMRTCVTKQTLENLSNLKSLALVDATEHCLQIEEGFQGLKSLIKLNISECNTLTYLPDVWLRHFTALETLTIFFCKELVELLPTHGMKYPLNYSIKHIHLFYLPKIAHLPEVLHHLIPSLQSLHLMHLPQLTLLPNCLGNFTSLEDLNIINCPRLTSLPASIKGMTNLKLLLIEQCPELQRRYEKEKGEDRHIIAHIPNLIVCPVN